VSVAANTLEAIEAMPPEYRWIAERAARYLETARYVAERTHLSFFTCGIAVALTSIESAIRAAGRTPRLPGGSE
jgi:hypothetical protein